MKPWNVFLVCTAASGALYVITELATLPVAVDITISIIGLALAFLALAALLASPFVKTH